MQTDEMNGLKKLQEIQNIGRSDFPCFCLALRIKSTNDKRKGKRCKLGFGAEKLAKLAADTPPYLESGVEFAPHSRDALNRVADFLNCYLVFDIDNQTIVTFSFIG